MKVNCNHHFQMGFTILEALVTLTLVSILLSSMLMITRSLSSDLIRMREKSLDQREISNFVQASSQLLATPSSIESTQFKAPVFEGSAREIRFYAPLPQGIGSGDIVAYRLFLGPDKLLHLSWRFDRDLISETDPVPPIDDVTFFFRPIDVSFSYFGPMNEQDEPHWNNFWSNPNRLPDAIKININIHDSKIENTISVRAIKYYCDNPANSKIMCNTPQKSN